VTATVRRDGRERAPSVGAFQPLIRQVHQDGFVSYVHEGGFVSYVHEGGFVSYVHEGGFVSYVHEGGFVRGASTAQREHSRSDTPPSHSSHG
jgi:hypothetical protein